MEHVHGIDVSWMTHGSPRDISTRSPQRRNTLPSPSPRASPTQSPQLGSSPIEPPNANADPNTAAGSPTAPSPSSPLPAHPPMTRNGSTEKLPNGGSPTVTPQRRGSWFSNISSKFGGGAGTQSPPQANHTPPKQAEISVPRPNPGKNAVLQHAVRHEGDAPYTPAPPKSSQPGLLQVLRRLSSSGGGGGGGGGNGGSLGGPKKNHGGLVERRVLNVDRSRERCALAELNQAKLRRVAFCVDVEIAPMPKYTEDGGGLKKKICEKTSKPKPAEKGGDGALEDGKTPQEIASPASESKAENPAAPADGDKATTEKTASEGGAVVDEPSASKAVDSTKKKDKKKKSEEERKARKEKKRKLAETNGTIPMEIHLDSDSSGSCTGENSSSGRSQSVPTTNPVRIYRRCCQLRETPILKKVTEQLTKPGNVSAGGAVEKLDLTAYWLQLPDLVTLGDYLAVVPVKEVLLENCGLNDEGLRVILAGLLAAKKPKRKSRRSLDSDSKELGTCGGVVERLVLKNNKIGPEGWKHICLFIYMCRSIKHLDLSSLSFPRATPATAPPVSHPHIPHFQVGHNRPAPPITTCQLFSKSLGNRLAGSTLELLNLAETCPDTDQLGVLMDGVIKCGVKRLGLAHNDIDKAGVAHVARYLASGACEGLDLGGNDLRDQLETLATSLPETSSFSALSLAECNLRPGSLCELFPKLVKLKDFRFIDFSHNHDLFKTSPSSISLLRRYLPKMAMLKRIHLADVSMTSEQAIALAEILPEVAGLAHIILLSNPELTKLADAQTEESQEEACALYASLLAATRVSTSIVAVDIDVPTERSGEIVKALAKQVVAYSLRNMENLPIVKPGGVEATGATGARQGPEYPDVLQHLVGSDVMRPDVMPEDVEVAPDDDYVIGGTGVVKALACCLKNRGDESRRPSGEFTREADLYSPPALSSTALLDMPPSQRRKIPGGKAKDMSKHLLGSARKIRQRLQPAMAKAKMASTASAQDAHTYQRLLFLDSTLDGIIKRFEDEFPDTREFAAADEVTPSSSPESTVAPPSMPLATSFGSDADHMGAGSDADDDEEGGGGRLLLGRPSKQLSRSNSLISMTSKGLTEEEGRVLRAGHRFRSGWIVTQEHYNLLSSGDAWASAGVSGVGSDPKHVRLLHELLEEVDDPELIKQIERDGVVAVFMDQRERIRDLMRSADPEHWERFEESQRMARANVKVSSEAAGDKCKDPAASGDDKTARPRIDAPETATGDEVAVCD
ncbi:hypothetical protein GGTG_07083 [Gaeumannomyces tritici R3-111a-1]|uniref:Cell wall biogenesis protein Mhp1 n=1 Tax=Gaeumannomyces tritici (strain R3-111a-1) TaxID=644352 RepID=J3P0N8_GAET3|nr:hypothetical protein GGTG_07083 [Gaeumannomyces tritici R3-111a-1]EJT77171.1 hypothetical protein GGTG_07083 [Gaeumannomyces tritici R3-111a-1]